jgi:hypothetical protein
LEKVELTIANVRHLMLTGDGGWPCCMTKKKTAFDSTSKEHLACVLHLQSERRQAPVLAANLLHHVTESSGGISRVKSILLADPPEGRNEKVSGGSK